MGFGCGYGRGANQKTSGRRMRVVGSASAGTDAGLNMNEIEGADSEADSA